MPDNPSDSATSRRMIETLLETPKLSIDKLPVLHTIIERLATTCSEGFRNICVPPATFFVNQVKGDSSWDILESYEDAIAGIYYVPEWDASVLFGIDRKFVFTLIETAYGADGSEPPYESDRPFSTLEVRFAKEVFGMVAKSFETCFESVASINLKFDRIENGIEFTVLGPNEMTVVAAQLLFQIMDSGGRMFILIPQSAIYPIRKKLEREHQPVSLPNDPRWTKNMHQEVSQAEVTLEAVLERRTMTLGEISTLHVGQLLQLRTHTQDLITIQSGTEMLFRAKLGQARGKFLFSIESTYTKKENFIHTVLQSKKPG